MRCQFQLKAEARGGIKGHRRAEALHTYQDWIRAGGLAREL